MFKSKHLVYLPFGSLLTGLTFAAALLQSRSVYADSFSMIGEWSGSPDCPITFYKDDGKYVEGNCDNGSYNHIFSGNYSNSNQISLTLTRIDPNLCKTSVPALISVIDNNNVSYWQGGWNGCGIRTQPVKQFWVRVVKFPSNSTETLSPQNPQPQESSQPQNLQPQESSQPQNPQPQNPSTVPSQPCLIQIGGICIFPPPQ